MRYLRRPIGPKCRPIVNGRHGVQNRLIDRLTQFI